MPIYEYECQPCRRITSTLILKKEEEKEVQCAFCGGNRLARVLSPFVLHKTEDQRLQDFDRHAPKSDNFYSDRRNIGLWAKKRAKELGADLGAGFEEVVEKARTARTPEDLNL
jgi:putative FmdB family regulatory protein